MAKLIADSTLGSAPNTYLYSLARRGDTFATIGSDDSLRLFDISLNLLNKVQPAHSGISCLASSDIGFVTAGRDGVIRIWDLQSPNPSLQIFEPKSRGFSSITHHGHYLAAGTESIKEGLGDVSVLIYDCRNASTPLRNYVESHTDTITQLAFHPAEPNVLLSGSTDGLISIFEVNVEEEDDALQRVLNPRSAVHCAGFLNNTSVYVATTDEHMFIYPLSDSDDVSTIEFGDVREKEDCTYIVNIIPSRSGLNVVCGHNINQTLSILDLDASRSFSIASRLALPGAHGDEIVRDFMLLGDAKKAITCGEDGQLKLWDLSGGFG